MYFLYEVPQGSVVSPILFNIYMKPVGEVILEHHLRYLQYADYTLLYISIQVMVWRLCLDT